MSTQEDQTIPGLNAFQVPHPHYAALELYKLEYTRAAQRYNDIYLAVWTNFSYMSLVAGGVLTFGGNLFNKEPLVPALLAHVPLFFWYMATFIPLNEYGDQVHHRLKDIERSINELFFVESPPGRLAGSPPASPPSGGAKSARRIGLWHFRRESLVRGTPQYGEIRSGFGHFTLLEHPPHKYTRLRGPGVRIVVLLFFLLLFSTAAGLSYSIGNEPGLGSGYVWLSRFLLVLGAWGLLMGFVQAYSKYE